VLTVSGPGKDSGSGLMESADTVAIAPGELQLFHENDVIRGPALVWKSGQLV